MPSFLPRYNHISIFSHVTNLWTFYSGVPVWGPEVGMATWPQLPAVGATSKWMPPCKWQEMKKWDPEQFDNDIMRSNELLFINYRECVKALSSVDSTVITLSGAFSNTNWTGFFWNVKIFCAQNRGVFASHSSDSWVQPPEVWSRGGGGSKGTHTYVVQTIPTFTLRGGNFVLWAHLENINIACKVLEGFTCMPRLWVHSDGLFLW